MRIIIIVIAAALISSCNQGLQVYYPSDSSNLYGGPSLYPESEPGKCYARCTVQNEYSVEDDTLAVFDIDQEIPSHYLKEVEYMPYSTNWIKKKTDKNCLSKDPNDCLVWCLQETPAKYKTPEVSIDRQGEEPKKYVVVSDRHFLIKEGGYTVWAEVICEDDITIGFVQNLHLSLIHI